MVAAVVVGGHAALGGAVVVAVLATGTAWIARGRGWWAPLVAAGAATASAIVFDARPSRAGALAAALVFELVVVSRMRRIVWTMPLVCSAIALAYGWDAIGAPGALVFGAGALAIAAATAAWGAPPWASRVLGLSAARGHPPAPIGPWCGAPRALSLGLAIAAVDRASDRAVLIPLAEAAGAGVVAMAMVGVRQWRFAPRRRAVDAVLLLGCSLAILLALSAGGRHRRRVVGGDPRRRAGSRPPSPGPSLGVPMPRPGFRSHPTTRTWRSGDAARRSRARTAGSDHWRRR